MNYNIIEEAQVTNRKFYVLYANKPSKNTKGFVSCHSVDHNKTTERRYTGIEPKWWRRLSTGGVRNMWMWWAYWGETAWDNDATLGMCSESSKLESRSVTGSAGWGSSRYSSVLPSEYVQTVYECLLPINRGFLGSLINVTDQLKNEKNKWRD